VQNELREMAEIDQVAAYIPQGKYKDYSPEQWNGFKDSVFSSNKGRVEKMFGKFGFLGFKQVGKDGAGDFYLLVQHADKYPQFQKKVLAEMSKAVRKGDANPNNYAYLYDRVKVSAGEKQLFGTQVEYETQSTGRARPKFGLTDSVNVDKIRNEYGLPPLKQYLNQMTEMHFEMNRKHYEEMGIKRPNTY